MKDKLLELMKYYTAKFIVKGIEEEKKSDDYVNKMMHFDFYVFLGAYQASDQRKTNSFVVPFFQTVSYDKLLNKEQRDTLHKMFETIDLEISLKHNDSIFSKRFDFYNQIIEEYEKKSDFDYKKYSQMVEYNCFHTRKYDPNNQLLKEEFLKKFGVQDEKYDNYGVLTYYHQISLQHFFIELFEFLNDENNITNDFVMEHYNLLNRESKNKYEMKKMLLITLSAVVLLITKKEFLII